MNEWYFIKFYFNPTTTNASIFYLTSKTNITVNIDPIAIIINSTFQTKLNINNNSNFTMIGNSYYSYYFYVYYLTYTSDISYSQLESKFKYIEPSNLFLFFQ